MDIETKHRRAEMGKGHLSSTARHVLQEKDSPPYVVYVLLALPVVIFILWLLFHR